MPYVLWKKNGKRTSTPFVFTESEVDNLASDQDNSYELINTTTHRKKKVGGRKQPKRRVAGKRRHSYSTKRRKTATRKTSQAARRYRKRKTRTKTLRRMMAAGRKRRRGMLRKPLPRVSRSEGNPFGFAKEPWGSWYEKVKRNAGPQYQAASQGEWEKAWRSGSSPGEAVEDVLNDFHRAWPYP